MNKYKELVKGLRVTDWGPEYNIAHRGRQHLKELHPAYGVMLSWAKLWITPDIDTAGALVLEGKPHIVVSEEWVNRCIKEKGLDDAHKPCALVIAHEIHHIGLKHCTVRSVFPNKSLGNQAMDCPNNASCGRLFGRDPAYYLYNEDGTRFGIWPGEREVPAKYGRMSADAVYADLVRIQEEEFQRQEEEQEAQSCEDNGSNDGDEGEGEEVSANPGGDGEAGGDGSGAPGGQDGPQMDDHDLWELGDDDSKFNENFENRLNNAIEPIVENENSPFKGEAKKEMRERLAKSKPVVLQSAVSRIRQMIGNISGPRNRADWNEVNVFSDELPGRSRGTGLPKMGIYMDVSYSVPNSLLRDLKDVVDGFHKAIPGIRFDLIKFTHEIVEVITDYRPGKFGEQESGGTDFSKVTEHIDANGYQAAVICTDGECWSVPKPRTVLNQQNLLWVLPKNRAHNQTWGTLVRM